MRARTLVAAGLLLGLLAVPSQAEPILEPGRGLIQPGMLVKLHGEPQCTGGFVYDGVGKLKGRVYLGLAAHCVEAEIGAVITDERNRLVGKVVISHWPYQSFADDWAFVEIDRAAYSRVSPAMAGHPTMPTGIGTTETVAIGHRAQLSGWGYLTEHTTMLREQRSGVINGFSKDLWHIEAVASNGDSGGPAADLDNGLALGSVSNFCVPLPIGTSDGFQPGCTIYGPTTVGIIERARKKGFPVTLRTAKQGPPR